MENPFSPGEPPKSTKNWFQMNNVTLVHPILSLLAHRRGEPAGDMPHAYFLSRLLESKTAQALRYGDCAVKLV